MALIMIQDLPRYECLLEAAKRFPDLDPSACEAFLHLLRAGDEALRASEPHLSRHNLSQGRFAVLMQLMAKSEACPPFRTPAELADRVGVTRATMTGLIDTLEKDGLVKREPAPEDRRMMTVRLTDRGQDVLTGVLPGHFKRMTELMRPLSEAERKTLVQLLAKVIRKPEPAEAPVAAAS